MNCGSDKKISKFPFQLKVFHDLINPITEQFLVIKLVQVCNLHRNISVYSDVLKCSSRGYKPRPAAGKKWRDIMEELVVFLLVIVGLLALSIFLVKTFGVEITVGVVIGVVAIGVTIAGHG